MIRALKVDTHTLALIDEFIKTDPDGHKKISDTISTGIKALTEAPQARHEMLGEDFTTKLVKPKKETKKAVCKKYGKKGPYTVKRTIKSHLGKETFYLLEGSDKIYPAEWFDDVVVTDSRTVVSDIFGYFLSDLLGIVMCIAFFIAAGYSLAVLQFVYIMFLI